MRLERLVNARFYMKDAAPQTVYLKDYKPTAFVIGRTNLTFDLYDDRAVVTANLAISRTVSYTHLRAHET